MSDSSHKLLPFVTSGLPHLFILFFISQITVVRMVSVQQPGFPLTWVQSLPHHISLFFSPRKRDLSVVIWGQV